AHAVSASDLVEKDAPSAGGYLLGNASDRMRNTHSDSAIYRSLVKAFNLVNFYDGYEAFGIALNEEDHTNKFLTKILATGKPIVFIVPEIRIGREGGATSAEYHWLITHPEALSRTTFVFGTYEMLDKDFAAKKAFRFHPEFEDALAERIKSNHRH